MIQLSMFMESGEATSCLLRGHADASCPDRPRTPVDLDISSTLHTENMMVDKMAQEILAESMNYYIVLPIFLHLTECYYN